MSRRFLTRDGRKVLLRQAVEEDAPLLICTVDSVAREQVYLIRSRFEVEEEWERAFIAKARDQGDLMLVALGEGEIVGWVTLFRSQAEFMRHTAQLGIGIIHGYRGVGLGAAMMEYALKWAAEHGVEKVNLGVRASNGRAQVLYGKLGFVQEGYRVRDIKDLDGDYDDHVEMALFVSSPSVSPPCEGSTGRENARAS
jgi:RimJ/RimL family protein N-acetyltransferase